MNSFTLKRLVAFAGMLWLLVPAAVAYPPAPDHTFHGMVRNEWGDPIDVSGAKVFIHSTDGAGAAAPIAASTLPGRNYQLIVPMVSARSTKVDFTSAGSLRQTQQFRLKVQIGSITYLPIEMLLTRPIGEPAGSSRLDLTLGADTDGDGLPDAWETANGLDPTDPNDANRDTDGDGISNRDEYLAGTYAFDPSDGFRLDLVEQTGNGSTLEFFAVRGRTYTFQASTNLLEWTPVTFRTQAGGSLQSNYPASEHKTLRLDVPSQDGETNRFFRAMVQ
jgi:hypothetical protein